MEFWLNKSLDMVDSEIVTDQPDENLLACFHCGEPVVKDTHWACLHAEE